jgi:hypothetical protein
VNTPTRSSYRPPAAMEPTPTWDSSISSSPPWCVSDFFMGLGEVAGVGSDAKELEAWKTWWAEAATTAS